MNTNTNFDALKSIISIREQLDRLISAAGNPARDTTDVIAVFLDIYVGVSKLEAHLQADADRKIAIDMTINGEKRRYFASGDNVMLLSNRLKDSTEEPAATADLDTQASGTTVMPVWHHERGWIGDERKRSFDDAMANVRKHDELLKAGFKSLKQMLEEYELDSDEKLTGGGSENFDPEGGLGKPEEAVITHSPGIAKFKAEFKNKNGFEVAVGGDDNRFVECITIPVVVTFTETVDLDGHLRHDTEVEYPSVDSLHVDADLTLTDFKDDIGSLISFAVRQIRDDEQSRPCFKLWRHRNAAYQRGLADGRSAA